MKIFRIVEDVNNYQWVMPENENHLLEHLSFECIPKKNEWQPLSMYIFNPKKKQGNFYSLGGAGAIVFDEKVLDAMLTIFEMAGEILPIKIKNITLYVLNVLECVNSLDENKSTWDYYDNGIRSRILKYAFHKNRMTESSIFKIPETCKTEVLAYTGIKDMEDEFLPLYERNGFTGLTFEKIDSDE